MLVDIWVYYWEQVLLLFVKLWISLYYTLYDCAMLEKMDSVDGNKEWYSHLKRTAAL